MTDGVNGKDLDAAPEILELDIDDARIRVAEAVAKSLKRTITSELARIHDPAVPLPKVEADNAKLMVQAAAELVVTLEDQVKRFSTPRILQPTRSRRTFRG